MRFTIFLLVFFTVSVVCHAQRKITMVKTFGGARFEMDTLTLSPKQVLETLEDNPLAHAEFKKGIANSNAAGVFGFLGGLLVGFPLGTAAIGGNPEWGYAAAGGALLAITIPFTRASRNHSENALNEYNKQLTSSRTTTRFHFTGSGARLVITF